MIFVGIGRLDCPERSQHLPKEQPQHLHQHTITDNDLDVTTEKETLHVSQAFTGRFLNLCPKT